MTDTSFLTPPLSPKSMPADISPQQQDQRLPQLADPTPSASDSTRSPSPTPTATTTGSSTPILSASVLQRDSHQPLAQILVLYHKATSTFLLRQLASAYSTSLEALELLARTNQDYGLDHSDHLSTRRSFFVLKQKLWILHTTIFGAMLSDRAAAALATTGAGTGTGAGSANGLRKRISGSSAGAKDSPEKLVKDLWRRLVDDYGGLEGDVDSQVMVPFTLLCVNQKLHSLARQIVEAYLATIPEGMLIHLETAAGVSLAHGTGGQKDSLMINYERLVELYLIHVLAKLGEWDYATDFLQYNSVLSDSSKKTYGKILDKLHQKSLRPKKVVSTKQQQHAAALDPLGSKSLSSSASPSVTSTSVSSPTLSSASTVGSPGTLYPTDTNASLNKNAFSAPEGHGTKQSSTGANSGRTKLAVTKTKQPQSQARTGSSVMTLQGRLLVLVQHYVELIRSASAQMGPNQLMVVVGLVVFLGALSRNRVRATKYVKAGMAKVMQTVKMGTTVTSI